MGVKVGYSGDNRSILSLLKMGFWGDKWCIVVVIGVDQGLLKRV